MAYQSAKPQIHAYSIVFGIFLIFLFSPIPLLSQVSTNLSSSSTKAKKAYVKAEDAFQRSDYLSTDEYLTSALKSDPDFKEALLLQAELYTETGRETDAIRAFETVISSDSNFFVPAYALVGNLYLRLGNFSRSANYFSLYLNKLRPDNPQYERVVTLLFQAKKADSLMSNPSAIELEKPGNGVNTAADEYVNAISLDQQQLLITRKSKKMDSQLNADQQERFFVSESKNEQWSEPVAFIIPGAKGNQGALTFSADGKKMFFSGCNWEGGIGSCDLYMSQNESGIWSEPASLGRRVNSALWESQPSLSSDGQTLFFSSNRKGGYGGSDIYKSILLDDGQWSAPINLGSEINTDGNEMSPFIHPDGKTLYFSSDGQLIRLGKSDIFLSRMDIAERWTAPVNVGYPVNTIDSELNIVIGTNAGEAFVSSDRDGDENGFDIYHFVLNSHVKPQAITYLKAKVIDDKTGLALQASYRLTELNTGAVFFDDKTTVDGMFMLPLLLHQKYGLQVEKEGYLLFSENYTLDADSASRPYEVVVRMKRITAGQKTVLHNVFYETGLAVIKDESKQELDAVVDFLRLNKNVTIEISGHTDNTGNDSLNQHLSEKRAESVKSYLLDKGIEAGRIQTKGYGSSCPMMPNDTDEGRAANRRTEMEIIALQR
ncbi:MAG: OmpA/MotB domain-containing protein [Bacteroidetes bacterium]|nr:MAG: OmpA/MotB domain-containing protein [Bacteroidota bacterium]